MVTNEQIRAFNARWSGARLNAVSGVGLVLMGAVPGFNRPARAASVAAELNLRFEDPNARPLSEDEAVFLAALNLVLYAESMDTPQ